MLFQVLMVATPGATIEDFQPLVDQEASKGWEYKQRGVLVDIFYTADSILPVHSRWDCSSRDELDGLIADFPMVKAGLLEADQIFQLASYTPFDQFDE